MLESFDSDFQLAEARVEGGRGAIDGVAKGGGCAVRFPRRVPRRSIELPDRVPAIIYFLSDRGDRLYGGCSVQRGVPGSAYVHAEKSVD